VAAFAPRDRPRITVANDGSVAAICEVGRITLAALPECAAFAEIAIDLDARVEVGWLGIEPQLLVLSSYRSHTIAQLFDPQKLAPIAELWVDSRLRLVATVEAHALALSSSGAAVFVAEHSGLGVVEWPIKPVPDVAGAGAEHFLVPDHASIVECDPRTRMPASRLPIPPHAAFTRLGGNARSVWATTQYDASRIAVIPLVNRGQSGVHKLPEPIAQVSGHPRSDFLACIGAETGRLYLVDLDSRAPLQTIAVPGIDRVESVAVVDGEWVGLLVGSGGRPITSLVVEGMTAAGRDQSLAVTSASEVPAVMAERLTQVPHATPTPASSVALWRTDVLEWARAVEAGTLKRRPSAPPVEALVERLGLPLELRPCFVLLYGAHLCGSKGARPVDVVKLLGPTWRENLGRGELVATGVLVFADSRVCLAPALLRSLDELP
jgi:hypothetical protein